MKECTIINDNFIKKEVTDVIKGVALILMFVHHFFTFPDWYIDGIAYPQLTWLCGQTNICVGIFAFLTGYCYYYTKEKTYRHSIKKASDVWITYVIVFFLLLIPAILLNVYEFSLRNFILELAALRVEVMVFCWYVVFYVTVMLILPVYIKAFEKSPTFWFGLVLIAPAILCDIVERVVPDDLKGFNQIIFHLKWLPCVASGLLFAKYNLFNQISNVLRRKNKIINIVVALLGVHVSARTRTIIANVDFVCVPLLIYGVVEIYNSIRIKAIFVPLKMIGKYSMLLWFLHCIFYNVCHDAAQPVLYFLRDPLLVTLWGLLLCLLVAVTIKPVIDFIIKLKNRAFDKLFPKKQCEVE